MGRVAGIMPGAAGALLGGALGLAAGAAGAQGTNKTVGTTESQKAENIPATTAPGAPHLLGDWGGVRTYLGNLGIDLQLDYTTETSANVSGGRRGGIDYADQIGLQTVFDWGKIAGIPGLSTHAIFVNRAGRNTSADYIGDPVIRSQEIYGAGFDMGIKLVYLYNEQSLWNDRVNLAAGRLAVGADFAAFPLYCNFMTLTICGHPRASGTYVMVGIYESKPFPPGGRTGWDWSTHSATGEVFSAELAWQRRLRSRQAARPLQVRRRLRQLQFPRPVYDVSDQPLAQTGAPARRRDGRISTWITANQMLVRTGRGPHDGLILLAAYAHNTPNTSLFEHFAWAGLLSRGFWNARPQDQIGLAITYYNVSHHLTATEQLQQAFGEPFSAGVYGVQSDAIVLEANYDFAIRPGIDLQPDIQYSSGRADSRRFRTPSCSG